MQSLLLTGCSDFYTPCILIYLSISLSSCLVEHLVSLSLSQCDLGYVFINRIFFKLRTAYAYHSMQHMESSSLWGGSVEHGSKQTGDMLKEISQQSALAIAMQHLSQPWLLFPPFQFQFEVCRSTMKHMDILCN